MPVKRIKLQYLMSLNYFLLMLFVPKILSIIAPDIQTVCGSLSGAVDMLPYNAGVALRYSAIPYAEPPCGPLRWKAPRKFKCPWPGVRNGSMVPVGCIGTGGDGSEDCLFVNVVSPVNNSALLPVMVFFHGGNLIGQNIASYIQGTEVLATQAGMVVVSIAYRLNTLGWLATPDMVNEPESEGLSGNFGVMDAILGLQWVQDNIAAFGGNPKNVSLFGHSSGGTMVFALMSSPAAAGLFASAFSSSGSANITQNAVSKWKQDAPIVSSVGCSNHSTAAARMDCLRAVPASVMGKATPSSWGTPGLHGWSTPGGLRQPSQGGMNYAGIVYVDGRTITAPFHEALAAGVVNAALIMSNMAAEGDGSPGIVLRNATQDQFAAIIQEAFQAWPNGSSSAKLVLSAYSAEARVDPQLAYDAIVSDFGLTCASSTIALNVLFASKSKRTAPLYLLYNAWPRSQWASNGAAKWPSHGLDQEELFWSWSFRPAPNDLEASRLLFNMLRDFAVNGGYMPETWGWEAVVPLAEENKNEKSRRAALDTLPWLMMAVSNELWAWPPASSSGTRLARGWKSEQCNALAAIGVGQQYWWCD